MADDERKYSFGPHPQAGWLLGLRGSQVIGIIIAALLCIAAMRAASGLIIIVYIAAICAATALLTAWRVAGHTLVEWIPVGGRYALMRMTGSAEFVSQSGSYVSQVPSDTVTEDTVERWQTQGIEEEEINRRLIDPQPSEPCVSLPAELADLEILETSVPQFGGRLGIVHNPRELTYTATVRATARAFYLLGAQERQRLLAQYGGLLAGFAQESSPVRRLAWYQRSFVAQPYELMDYYRQHRQIEAGSRQDEAMWQLLNSQNSGTPERELFMSVQIDLRRLAASNAAQKIASSAYGGDRKQGAIALTAQYTVKLVDELSYMGLLSEPAVPSARELARIIRDGIDPFTRADRERPPAGHPPGIEPHAFGPQYRLARPTFVQTDSALHRTGHLVEWPKTDVRATFLQGLLMDVGVTRTVSVVMEVMPPTKAMHRAERASESREAEQSLRHKIGRRTTARDRQQYWAAQHREQELAEGHALVKYAGFVTVSVPVEEEYGGGLAELDNAWSRVSASAVTAGLRLEREICQQEQALTHTLVGLCRGLV